VTRKPPPRARLSPDTLARSSRARHRSAGR
jgi:hypothetical protein